MSDILPIFVSHYSFKSILTLEEEGTSKEDNADSIVDIALSNNLKEIILVDDNPTGLLQAFQNTKSENLKLIFGLKLIATQNLEKKDEESLSKNHKIIIFAKNNQGWKKLIKIFSKAANEGKYYIPRIDFNFLNSIWDDKDLKLVIPFYDSFIFQNNFTLSSCIPDFSQIKPTFLIEENFLPFDEILKKLVLDYIQTYNFPVIESQTIYYKNRIDFLAWQTYRCIKERSRIEEPELSHCSSDSFCFENWLEKNTGNNKIFTSEFENLDIKLHGVRLPEIKIDEKYKLKYSLKSDATNLEFLRALCIEGYKRLGIEKGSENEKKYGDRVKFELNTFDELGFVDYILLVWQVINFCKENKIPTGLGRGSAAGSLVLFLIGVTKIDSIKYNLYFERFISKTRAKKTIVDGITYLDGSLMCDVDCDIDFFRRNEVIKFLEETFPNRVCKLSTLNTLSGKLLIKECGKVISNKPEEEMTRVSEMIPKIFGVVRDIKETKEGKMGENGKWKIEPTQDFVDWCNENDKVYKTALKLRDLAKNKSVHPSAIIVSYDPIDVTIPTELSKRGLACSYDMSSASILTVKLDVLGLRCVSLIDAVCKLTNVDIEKIDFNDTFIYQNLQELKTPHGIFQLEADCNFKVSNQVKPKNLEELAAVIALARPGALQFVEQFSRFTNTGTFESIHPFFDEVLKKTGGLCIFQEQMMQMATKVGFSLEEAETLRRIVGKKKPKEMAEWQDKVAKKCLENKLPKEVGDVLWKVLDASKDYSFNKSHAIAYASLSAATTYLKFKYPTEFFLCLLQMTMNEPNPIEEIEKIQKEMRYFNISLLPPHLLKSEINFTIQDGNIRMGLLCVKGFSEKSIEKLNKFRHPHSTKFEIFQAAEESKLSIAALVTQISVGALDGSFKQSRPWMVLEAQTWHLLTEKEKIWANKLAESFDYDLIKIIPELVKTKDTDGKPIIKESRFGTIKKNYAPFKAIYKQNSKNVDFFQWFMMKKYLGFTSGKTLKDIFIEKRPGLISLEEFKECYEKEQVAFVGQVIDVHKGVTKAKKANYIKFKVADETDQVWVWVFNDSIEEIEELNGGKMPKEADFVIVRGEKKGNDSIFSRMVKTQSNEIYTRISEIKKKKDLDDNFNISDIVFQPKKKIEEDDEEIA